MCGEESKKKKKLGGEKRRVEKDGREGKNERITGKKRKGGKKSEKK